MTHTYTIEGMTCAGCEAKVKYLLTNVPNVTNVDVTRTSATITMNKHIPELELQNAIGENGRYKITTNNIAPVVSTRTWLETYKPILLIFSYVTVIATAVQWASGGFSLMVWMQYFMAGFFLVFSFFKLLNLKGFADSYAMYDVLAKRIPAWGYVYAFIELALGIAYTVNFNPRITNIATLVVMSISIVGVLQSVLNKKQIQCACLGAIFNLPMSTVTIIEDGLMIAMSAVMLIMY